MDYTPVFSHLSVLPNSDQAKRVILFFRIAVIMLLLEIVLNVSTLFSIRQNGIPHIALFVAGVFSLLTLIPYLLLGIFFVIWMKRAYDNLYHSGTENLRYTSGWAIAGWFIPLANLVIPYRIIKEIWDETQQTFYKDPIGEIYESSIVDYWWGTYIGSMVLGIVSYYFLTHREFEIGYCFVLGGNALTLFSAFYGSKMVRDLSGYENEMIERAEGLYQLELAETAKKYLENPGHESGLPNASLGFANAENETIELSADFIDNSDRSRFVKIGMQILIGFAFVYGAFCFHVFSEANFDNYTSTMGAANSWLTNISRLGLVVLCLTGLIGMLWTHRAYSNLHNLKLKGLSFPSGTAFYCWLLPIGNLFIPFIILAEINKFSQLVLQKKDLPNQKPIANTGLLICTWILFLFSGLCLLLSFYYLHHPVNELFFRDINGGTFYGMLGAFLSIPTLFLGTIALKNISKIESELYKKVEEGFVAGNEEENNVTEVQ